MKKLYSFDDLLRKAASYCSISEHCVSEVEAKLKVWDVSEPDRTKIIEKLQIDDFINEKRYAGSFAGDKFRFNKWGKIKISLALREKGIDKQLIADAVQKIDEGEYEELLATLLQNKVKTLKYNFEYEKQGKLFRFAQSRGFENNVIERVIRTIY
ncbi:MAG: regulatory protein RecX [Paludibacteraceae bacterium]